MHHLTSNRTITYITITQGIFESESRLVAAFAGVTLHVMLAPPTAPKAAGPLGDETRLRSFTAFAVDRVFASGGRMGKKPGERNTDFR